MASIGIQITNDNGTKHNLVLNPARLTDARMLVLARGVGYQPLLDDGSINPQSYQDYLLSRILDTMRQWHDNRAIADAQSPAGTIIL